MAFDQVNFKTHTQSSPRGLYCILCKIKHEQATHQCDVFQKCHQRMRSVNNDCENKRKAS